MLKWVFLTIYGAILFACIIACAYALSVAAWGAAGCFAITILGVGFAVKTILDKWDELLIKEIK